MKLSKERRAELRALAEKATKGPWPLHTTGDFKRIIIAPHGNSWGTDVGEVYSDDADYVEAEATAAFIAASRQALPDALADIEELEAKLAEAVKALEEMLRQGVTPRQHNYILAVLAKLKA